MFSSSSMHHRNSIITRGGMTMMMNKLLFQPQNFPFSSPSLLHQSLRTYKTSRTVLEENQETSEQRIARELESIAKEEIIQQSDSTNFDNVINQLKNSCSGTVDEKQQLASSSSSSSSSLLKFKLPRFSDQYRSRCITLQTPPTVVLYDKYPLGDLLRYWFLYSKPYSHLGSDYHGINNFFRLVTRGRICPLFDDTTKENQWLAELASYEMHTVAKSVYPQVTIRDLASSKVSEAVPLRAFKLFDTFENILTTDHSAQIAQKNHVVPPGKSIVNTGLASTYKSHWNAPTRCPYVYLLDGTAGSGKTIGALQMAHGRPYPRTTLNYDEDITHNRLNPETDLVIYINVEDVYVRGKPWKEFGKAHLEKLCGQHVLRNTSSYSSECDDFLEKALVETFDRLLPPSQFKEDFNTEYRVVIVLDDMDRNFALRLQNQRKTNIERALQEKFFGPFPTASTHSEEYRRIFRVSFIVNAPVVDEVGCHWPFRRLSTVLDFRKCRINGSILDHFSSLKKERKNENLRLAEALCSNARCAALLSSALCDSNIQKEVLEAKKENSAKSMKSLNNLLKSSLRKVVREYIKRSGLSKFQHPDKALLVALAISTFHVPILPRTLQHCPLLRKTLKLVGENDVDVDIDDSKNSLYDLLVEGTRLLYDKNAHAWPFFQFTTSAAHLAMIHIIFGIPFSAENFGDKPTSEKCFLISLVAPYFAEIKRALFLELFDYEVGVGQSVRECQHAVRKKAADKNIGREELMCWESEEIAAKETTVFDYIDLRGKPSDVVFFKNDLCMATENIDAEEFEQRFKTLEKEVNNKWSNSSQRNSYPIFILSTAEVDTFPQVAVVGPGKVVLVHEQKSSHSGITTAVVKADDDVDHDDNKSLNNLLASCLGKGSSGKKKKGSKQEQRSGTGAQIRYLKALQGIAKKLVLANTLLH